MPDQPQLDEATERHLFRQLNQASQNVRREAAHVARQAQEIGDRCADGCHLPGVGHQAMFDLNAAMTKRATLIDICQALGVDSNRIVESAKGEVR